MTETAFITFLTPLKFSGVKVLALVISPTIWKTNGKYGEEMMNHYIFNKPPGAKSCRLQREVKNTSL